MFFSRFNEAAGVYRDWPKSRGIYHNPAKNFLVWLNEEDNLRIISMQMGGNLGEVYKRLVTVSLFLSYSSARR
jgi:creatine kinase